MNTNLAIKESKRNKVMIIITFFLKLDRRATNGKHC